MSNKFEILMHQLDMPLEMRNSEAFLNAEIEKVLVHKVSRVWEFHFSFANILPIEIFRELQKRLAQEFSKTGNQAIFEIHCSAPQVLITSWPLKRDLVPAMALRVCIRICRFIWMGISC